MYVARAKSTKNAAKRGESKPAEKAVDPLVDLDAYLEKRDFVGALTLLYLYQQEVIDRVQFPPTVQQQKKDEAKDSGVAQHATSDGLPRTQLTTWWIAYCRYQNGDFSSALGYFDQLLDSASPMMANYIDAWRMSRACCLYFTQCYDDAEKQALLTTRLPLCNRLLYLLAHRRQKSGGERVLLDRYKNLSQDSIEDQLALAFTSYERHNYQECVEIYKRLALLHRDSTAALHVYLAMCYFQLDYYDVSLELLAVYLEAYSYSFVATNLKASNQFRLYSGVEASQELETFRKRNPAHPASIDASPTEVDPTGTRLVLQHNLAIFEDSATPNTRVKGILKPLLGQIEEARMNLVLALLHRHEYKEAFDLIEDLEEPQTPVEHIVKGTLHAMIGDQTDSKEHIFLAEKYFHAIGSSPQDRDTIPGRQSMASYFMLRKEYADANVYLNSISTYLISSDAFNWNYGLSLAASEVYDEAEEVLLRVQSEKLKSDLTYCSWLARCHVFNTKNAELAWELYLRMENTEDAFKLLKLIANDYYRVKNYYFAVKAFDVLERLEPDPEYWEAKRGACLGFFQQIATGHEPLHAHRCDEVLKLLLTSKNVIESNRLGTMLKKWVQTFM